MEQPVLFEQKVYLTPKDMNRMANDSIDTILVEHLRTLLENKCSQHGFVIGNSLEPETLIRNTGQLENGRFTGNIVFHTQIKGFVYNPVNGTKLTGIVMKKNKMGLYVIYKDAIRILIPRDLHRDNDEFENLQIGDVIQIEIRKSRFQINDPFILSIGVYLTKADKADVVEVPMVPAQVPIPASAPKALVNTTKPTQKPEEKEDDDVKENEEEDDYSVVYE